MKSKNESEATGALKLGEKIIYDRWTKKLVDTKYGVGTLVVFIKDGKVIRKTFAGSALLSFLSENKDAKSVELVEKVSDGEYTLNIYN